MHESILRITMAVATKERDDSREAIHRNHERIVFLIGRYGIRTALSMCP